jgi:hypothetical protein
MKKCSLFYFVLSIILIGINNLNAQTLTLVSSTLFDGPGNIADGDLTTWAATNSDEDVCSISFLTLRVNESNYIKTITVNIEESISRDLALFASNTAGDYSTGSLVRHFKDEFGVYTLDVNRNVSYIYLTSDPLDHNRCGTLLINEITVNNGCFRKELGYDGAGNNTSRLIIRTKSSEEETEPEEFSIDEKSLIKLYPNPTSGMLFFEVQQPDEDKSGLIVSAKVYNINGSLLRDDKFNSSAFTIDISDEQNGTYLLDMTVNGKAKKFTVIKQ